MMSKTHLPKTPTTQNSGHGICLQDLFCRRVSDKVTLLAHFLVLKTPDNQKDFHNFSPNFSNSADDSPDQPVDRIKMEYHG
jgi:hypothetical protein